MPRCWNCWAGSRSPDFLSHPLRMVSDMNTVMLLSTTPATEAVADAVALLADLGAEVVDHCSIGCKICDPVLDAAA